MAVVGAGLMGQGIAQTLALAGFRVNLTDVRSEALTAEPGRLRSSLKTLAEHGLVTRVQCKNALQNLQPVGGTSEAVQGAGFVIEAITEDLELKKHLFEKLEEVCGKETILASNTSTLKISDIAQVLHARGRLIGMHWWNPPYLMPLVELLVGPETAPETVESTVALVKQLGKVPLICKHGGLGVRLQGVLMVEAVRMLEEGVASAEDIDAAARLTLGLRLPIMGPLQIIDFAGAATVLHSLENLSEESGERFAAPDLLRNNLQRGWSGVQAGRGFYAYTAGQKREALERRDGWLIQKMKEDSVKGRGAPEARRRNDKV